MCLPSRPGSAPTFPKIKTSSIQCSGLCEQGEGWDDFEPRNQQCLSMVQVRPGKEREPG